MAYNPVYPEEGRNYQYNNTVYDDQTTPLLDKDVAEELRRGFTFKVCGVVSAMLSIPTLGVLSVIFNQSINDFMVSPAGYMLTMICSVTLMVFSCCLICISAESMRIYPLNMILLFSVAFLASPGVMIVAAVASPTLVIYALLITISLVVLCGLVAYFSPVDLTLPAMVCSVICAVVSLVCVLIMLFTSDPETKKTVFQVCLWFGLSASAFGLVYEIQSVCGRQENLATYTIDDVFYASFGIFLDIINMFKTILMLLMSYDD